MLNPPIAELPFSSNGTVTWIHIGDTHLTRSGEQNEIDLGRIVDEINRVYARGGVDFVFIPGDIADDGSVVAYEVFRKHLDRLRLPWFAILGDHDVHEKSFENFRQHVATDLYSAFSIGPYRFLRLNAFSVPKPDSFVLDDEQLLWIENELKACESSATKAVLLLHCYPSDLKQGGERLTQLIHRYPVLLVDMGHTHYNELSNDGKVLYSATRSTGQVEEGPVGYSITTIDRDVVSWHFVEVGSLAATVITQPADERLLTERIPAAARPQHLSVRAKVWPAKAMVKVSARMGQVETTLTAVDDVLWGGSLQLPDLQDGVYDLQVTATDERGEQVSSSVRVALGAKPERKFSPIDQENSIGKWAERGLLDTQLGPNKNGRKW